MTTLKANKVRSSLKKKGFNLVENSHHYYWLYYNGKKTNIRTHVSHNDQIIDDYLINKMKKQVCLSKEDFLDLINCPLSKEEYIQKLLDKGQLK